MNVLAVAEDSHVLDEIAAAAGPLCGENPIGCFTDPLLAIKHAYFHPIDLALIATDLRRVDGASFGETLRKKYPDIRLIFVSEHDGPLAQTPHASACIRRPLTADAVKDIIEKS